MEDLLDGGEDGSAVDVFDINWSCDGTTISAGFQKSIVLLDMTKILSQSVDSLILNNE